MFDYIDPAILPVGFFLVICSTVGIIGNTLIVLCTVKTKRFRSPCHILICLTCLADIFHLSGQFPFCIHLFGNITSTQAECYFMMILPIIGLTLSGPLILAMGIDRFIAIKFPMMYRYYLDHPACYLAVQLVFPIVYSTFFIVYGALEIDFNPKNQIKCAIPTSMNGPSFPHYTHSTGIILSFVFLVYLTVFVLLRLNTVSKKLRVVFRSIAVTVIFLLFGWMTTMVASVVIYKLPLEPEMFHIVEMYCGIPVNLALASNFLVFYMINSEYRMAIKSLIFCDSRIHSTLQTEHASSHHGGQSHNKLSKENLGNIHM